MCKKVVEAIKAVILVLAEVLRAYCKDDPPEYDPMRWNGDDLARRCNNCYNYACNIQTDTFAQPGYPDGLWPYQDFYCSELSEAAIADGLKAIDADNKCNICGHKVALVRDSIPPVDYHWYRQDRDGTWSHKIGDGPATNLDNSDQPITNPRTADRGRYTDFCGFFCAIEGKIKIDGPGVSVLCRLMSMW